MRRSDFWVYFWAYQRHAIWGFRRESHSLVREDYCYSPVTLHSLWRANKLELLAV